MLLAPRSCCILYCDFNINNVRVFKVILSSSSLKCVTVQKIQGYIALNFMKTKVFLI
jgi:hypothetical protein